jgi:hypothetical protein
MTRITTMTMAEATIRLSARPNDPSAENRQSAVVAPTSAITDAAQAPHLRPAVAAKRRATVERNKAAFRAAKLCDIERQVSEVSLVIRQMTDAERSAPRKRR